MLKKKKVFVVYWQFDMAVFYFAILTPMFGTWSMLVHGVLL